MSLVLGLPLYKNLSASFFTRFVALDKSMVIGTATVDGVYVPVAMSLLVEKAMSLDGWTRLVILEHDMLPPEDALKRIDTQYPDEADIVGGLYFTHHQPHVPVAHVFQDGHYKPLGRETIKTMTDSPGLYKVDAIGFGVTSIHRRVLEKWDDSQMFLTEPTLGSHDLHFCKEATRQGFGIYLDSGMVCGHLTETAVTIESYEACVN